MKLKILITLIVLISTNAVAEENKVVYRKPFTLKLPVDKERYYEQEYPEVPYVIENRVFIFPKENFRIGMTFADGKVARITYDPDKIFDQYLEFEFKPDFINSDEISMMLTAKNNTEYDLTYNAVMVVPGRGSPLKTSIVPINAGLMNYELWPHPILQLMLTNFRVVKK